MNPENQNNRIEIRDARDFEIMKTPEIIIQEERGAQLLSLLLKAENPEWGETETPIAQETEKYFRENPLDAETLKTIQEFQDAGVDEETLYNLALTYQHPERVEPVFAMMAKHKAHVENPQEVYKKVISTLESFDIHFSSSELATRINEEIELDKKKRMEGLSETKQRIEALIDFFRPSAEATNIKRLCFIPTDPLYKKNSGTAFLAFPGEQIIQSHIDNTLNQDHEFLHGIINPVVSKLEIQLDDQQKLRISSLASEKLKRDYGDNYYSLLCEEFIRVYGQIFSRGERPETYDTFAKKIETIDEGQFQKFLLESDELRLRCQELGINSIEDLREKSKEYYDKFEADQLRDLIFDLYEEYVNRPDRDGINFESFVLENFGRRI
ncbi:MAG: hypothetical protein WC610_02845 [Patescibacteria group bacterium]